MVLAQFVTEIISTIYIACFSHTGDETGDETGDDVILADNDVILRFTCKLRYSDARYILTNGTLLVQQ